MTLFCLLATLTSLSCATWVTKNFFLSASNHNARFWNPNLGLKNTISKYAFVAAPAEIRNPTECIAVFLLGWPRPDAQAPPRISSSALWDLCYWCTLALDPKCLPTKRTPALRRLFAFARVQHRLKIKHDDMRKSFRFLFWIQLSSFEIMLPTLDQLETLVEDRLPSFQRSRKLHLSCQPSLALPCLVFSKATTSFRRPGKHLGQQCQRQAWNWNKVFVSVQKPSTGCPGRLLSLPWPHIW